MSDKYTLIAAEYAANIAVPAAGAPTLTKMCLWIGVSKSGFYDWKDRPLSATAVRQEYLRGKIEEIFDDNDETYGYRRVHAELVRQGEQATSELVRRLMRDLGLAPCQVRKPRSLTAQATDIADPEPGQAGLHRRCPLPQAHQRYWSRPIATAT